MTDDDVKTAQLRAAGLEPAPDPTRLEDLDIEDLAAIADIHEAASDPDIANLQRLAAWLTWPAGYEPVDIDASNVVITSSDDGIALTDVGDLAD